MADDKNDQVEITVEVLGEKLKVILPGMGWTFEEAILAKSASGGLPTTAIEAGLWAGDPDAWLAVLRVSYLRAGREFPARELQDVKMLELVDAITEKVEEAGAKRPPTSPSGSEPSGPDEPTENEPPEAPSSE